MALKSEMLLLPVPVDSAGASSERTSLAGSAGVSEVSEPRTAPVAESATAVRLPGSNCETFHWQ